MKRLTCPLNGPRNVSEFVCAGEVRTMPDPGVASDQEWSDYLFMRDNRAGVVREWWCHVPTAFWFIAERDTVTDEVIATYPPDRLFPARIDFGEG